MAKPLSHGTRSSALVLVWCIFMRPGVVREEEFSQLQEPVVGASHAWCSVSWIPEPLLPPHVQTCGTEWFPALPHLAVTLCRTGLRLLKPSSWRWGMVRSSRHSRPLAVLNEWDLRRRCETRATSRASRIESSGLCKKRDQALGKLAKKAR